jgi:leader peptidase (prepilin peptidase) / N-methyltransferase
VNGWVAVSLAGVAGAGAGGVGSWLAGSWAARRPIPATVLAVPRPLTIAVSAALWAGIVWRWGLTPATLLLVGLAWVVVTAADVDLRAHVIPDRLTLRAAGVFALAVVLLGGSSASILSAFVFALVLPAVLLVTSWLFRLVRGEAGIGLGDVKLTIPIGLVLGRLGTGHVVLAMAVTFVAAGVVTAVLLLLGRIGTADRLPYGPYLALGTVGALVGGDAAVGLLGLVIPR